MREDVTNHFNLKQLVSYDHINLHNVITVRRKSRAGLMGERKGDETEV